MSVEADTFATLALDAIVSSPTNPRTHFDDAKLIELSLSIQASGVHQPVLVRPLPASRLADTSDRPQGKRPTHELVAGERRWRASKRAQGVTTIPAMVRNLTDGQVLEIQLVENLQRDDLHPMEEAEGYERLCAATGISKDDIGSKIGKSRAYVYGRLKLLELTADARKAFFEGKIDASRALVIARIPDSQLQAKALEYATKADWQGAVPSYKAFLAWAQNNVMLRLDAARFKITDAALLPDAGDCKACPKRTGAAPDLFNDVPSADVCTDPKCYHDKEAAHDQALIAKAEARGQTIIGEREAKKIWPYQGSQIEGYVRLDKPDHRVSSTKMLKTVLGKSAPDPVLLANPHNHGELVEVLPADTVRELLKEKGHITAQQASAEKRSGKAISAAEAKRKVAEKYEKTWRQRAIVQTFRATQSTHMEGLSYKVIRLAARGFITELSIDERQHICKLLDLGKVADRETILGHIDDCDDLDIESVLLLLMMERDMRNMFSYNNDAPNVPAHIVAIAADYEVDLTAIQEDVKAEMKEAAKPKSQPTANAPAALAANGEKGKPTPSARKPKLTAKEASSGIAVAMQGLKEPAVPADSMLGKRVRVTAEARQPKLLKWVGQEGEVRNKTGDTAWEVVFFASKAAKRKVAEFVIFDRTELEVVE